MPPVWAEFILNASRNTHFVAQAGKTKSQTAKRKLDKTVEPDNYKLK